MNDFVRPVVQFTQVKIPHQKYEFCFQNTKHCTSEGTIEDTTEYSHYKAEYSHNTQLNIKHMELITHNTLMNSNNTVAVLYIYKQALMKYLHLANMEWEIQRGSY